MELEHTILWVCLCDHFMHVPGGVLARDQQISGYRLAMYYRDHRPPHFHAKYGSYEIVVSIEDGVVEWRFPRRALQHVLEWFTIHRQALMENWELAEQRKPLKPIPPLE